MGADFAGGALLCVRDHGCSEDIARSQTPLTAPDTPPLALRSSSDSRFNNPQHTSLGSLPSIAMSLDMSDDNDAYNQGAAENDLASASAPSCPESLSGPDLLDAQGDDWYDSDWSFTSDVAGPAPSPPARRVVALHGTVDPACAHQLRGKLARRVSLPGALDGFSGAKTPSTKRGASATPPATPSAGTRASRASRAPTSVPRPRPRPASCESSISSSSSCCLSSLSLSSSSSSSTSSTSSPSTRVPSGPSSVASSPAAILLATPLPPLTAPPTPTSVSLPLPSSCASEVPSASRLPKRRSQPRLPPHYPRGDTSAAVTPDPCAKLTRRASTRGRHAPRPGATAPLPPPRANLSLSEYALQELPDLDMVFRRLLLPALGGARACTASAPPSLVGRGPRVCGTHSVDVDGAARVRSRLRPRSAPPSCAKVAGKGRRDDEAERIAGKDGSGEDLLMAAWAAAGLDEDELRNNGQESAQGRAPSERQRLATTAVAAVERCAGRRETRRYARKVSGNERQKGREVVGLGAVSSCASCCGYPEHWRKSERMVRCPKEMKEWTVGRVGGSMLFEGIVRLSLDIARRLR